MAKNYFWKLRFFRHFFIFLTPDCFQMLKFYSQKKKRFKHAKQRHLVAKIKFRIFFVEAPGPFHNFTTVYGRFYYPVKSPFSAFPPLLLTFWCSHLVFTHWWYGRDYGKWIERREAIAKWLTPSISMLILSLSTSMFAMIALVAQLIMFQRYFVSSRRQAWASRYPSFLVRYEFHH